MTQPALLSRRATALVDHILDHPGLLPAVRSLAAPVLKRVVDHVGLEDAGALVELATVEQLEGVFDEDLWKSERPGSEEVFDADRFALWLAVWVDQDERRAALKIATLDPDLVTLAFSKLILVIDIEMLAQRLSSAPLDDEGEQLDKRLESSLCHEFDQYRVIARDPHAWDAILTVLVELYGHDLPTFERIVSRCCDLTSQYVEEHGGLLEVLSAEATLEADVAGDREERREAQGFVPPVTAVTFLKWVREQPRAALRQSDLNDPISGIHLRKAGVAGTGPTRAAAVVAADAGGFALAQAKARGLALLNEALRAAGVLSEGESPLLPRARGGEPLLRRALRVLRARDPANCDRRMLEAAFLANVLLSGVGTEGCRLTPAEAGEAAFALANLGAQQLFPGEGRAPSAAQLADELVRCDLVRLFGVGFHSLCWEHPLPSPRAERALAPLRRLLIEQGLIAPD